MVAKRFLVLLLFWVGSVVSSMGETAVIDLLSFKTFYTNWFKPEHSFSAQLTFRADIPKDGGTFFLNVYKEGNAFRTEEDQSKITGDDDIALRAKLSSGFGLGQITEIARIDAEDKMILYPSKKVYYVARQIVPKDVSITKVPDGTETIEGHPCRRTKVVLGDGKPIRIWHATDLEDFPIQIQIGSAYQINFRNVKLGKQNPDLFKVPSDYTRYKDRFEILDLAFGLGKYKKAPGKITGVHVPDSYNNQLPAELRNRSVTKADLNQMKRSQADQKALEFQKKRAAEGNATSQYDLGLRYWKGDGVDKDENVAMDLMQKAAAGGNSQAKKFLETNRR